MSVDALTADMGSKAAISAEYVCKPHLGMFVRLSGRRARGMTTFRVPHHWGREWPSGGR